MNVRAGVVAVAMLLSVAVPAMATPVAAQSCSFPVTVTDATGSEVTVAEEPERVVTLSPSAAQTMWEIGGRDKVVGLTKYASYLDGAASRTTVSTAEQIVSYETVVNLTPDLVLAPNVISNETVEKLRDAGLTVYYFPPAETIDDVYRKTERIGRLTGECDGAEQTVAWMQERIGTAREAAGDRPQPDVLYLFFGYTAGRETFINEIIETAGGNNVALAVNVTGYQPLNPEIVVEVNPDWIVLNSENPAGLDQNIINQTTAGRQNQTIVVQIEHLNQPAPRIVHAITKLAKRFHPDAYAAANATPSPTPTPTATATATPVETVTAASTRTTTPTSSPGQPGFGVPTILGGLGLVVLLGKRHL